jgi:hypothetical protein
MKILLLTILLAFGLIIAGPVDQFPVNIEPEVDPAPTVQNPLLLSVPALKQSKATSCGEAVIAMAYNYAYPETPLDEAALIAYAAENGYYTSGAAPFTSPADMKKIVAHYGNNYQSGHVSSQAQGLDLLKRKLQAGQPVMIDILTRLNDRESGAHFVLVTGIFVDPRTDNMAIIYYNNPLSGKNRAAAWGGSAGLWNAWKNNGDPGGAGWWLVIAPQ